MYLLPKLSVLPPRPIFLTAGFGVWEGIDILDAGSTCAEDVVYEGELD